MGSLSRPADEAGGVGDVGQKEGADFVGNLAETDVVPVAAVRRSATDDHFRLDFAGFFGDFVHVYKTGCFLHAVEVCFEVLAAEVGRVAVAEVAAVGEAEAKGLVTGLKAAKKNGRVGLGTRVGLYVGVFGAKELAEAVDGQLLDLIYDFTATVVALAGVTFCIFVRQTAAHRVNNGLGGEVFRSNQLDAVALAFEFTFDKRENSGITSHIGCFFVARFGSALSKAQNYTL